MRTILFSGLLGLGALIAPVTALAADAPAGTPAGTVTPAFDRPIPNIPGKHVMAVVVDYPPGGKTPSHHHPGSAFINGYVLSGAIRSQVDGGEVRVFHAGESWSERPGAHHQVSENASTTEPARLLAIFILDDADKDALVTVEK
jgi:quercetin dioxygenase-like cupin family protein